MESSIGEADTASRPDPTVERQAIQLPRWANCPECQSANIDLVTVDYRDESAPESGVETYFECLDCDADTLPETRLAERGITKRRGAPFTDISRLYYYTGVLVGALGLIAAYSTGQTILLGVVGVFTGILVVLRAIE